MLLRSNFSSFPHYFIYIFLTSGVKLHIDLLNKVVQFIVFLILSTLICRSTDISKCFSESLGVRDNEVRLYVCFFETLKIRIFRITFPFIHKLIQYLQTILACIYILCNDTCHIIVHICNILYSYRKKYNSK